MTSQRTFKKNMGPSSDFSHSWRESSAQRLRRKWGQWPLLHTKPWPNMSGRRTQVPHRPPHVLHVLHKCHIDFPRIIQSKYNQTTLCFSFGCTICTVLYNILLGDDIWCMKNIEGKRITRIKIHDICVSPCQVSCHRSSRQEERGTEASNPSDHPTDRSIGERNIIWWSASWFIQGYPIYYWVNL